MKTQELEVILRRMLNDNVTITARAIAREPDSPFRHASDLTRQPDRKALLDRYQLRQVELRSLVEKTDKQSRTNLQVQVTRLAQEVESLKSERDLLIASHKAMLLAVGEMGGMSAWRKFFLSGKTLGRNSASYRHYQMLWYYPLRNPTIRNTPDNRFWPAPLLFDCYYLTKHAVRP